MDWRWSKSELCSLESAMTFEKHNTVSGGPVLNVRTILYPRRYESHLSGDFSVLLAASPGQSGAYFMLHDPFLAFVI